jgi:hypothetical protein
VSEIVVLYPIAMVWLQISMSVNVTVNLYGMPIQYNVTEIAHKMRIAKATKMTIHKATKIVMPKAMKMVMVEMVEMVEVVNVHAIVGLVGIQVCYGV